MSFWLLADLERILRRLRPTAIISVIKRNDGKVSMPEQKMIQRVPNIEINSLAFQLQMSVMQLNESPFMDLRCNFWTHLRNSKRMKHKVLAPNKWSATYYVLSKNKLYHEVQGISCYILSLMHAQVHWPAKTCMAFLDVLLLQFISFALITHSQLDLEQWFYCSGY